MTLSKCAHSIILANMYLALMQSSQLVFSPSKMLFTRHSTILSRPSFSFMLKPLTFDCNRLVINTGIITHQLDMRVVIQLP